MNNYAKSIGIYELVFECFGRRGRRSPRREVVVSQLCRLKRAGQPVSYRQVCSLAVWRLL
jgi:hypothetical protein